MTIDIWFSNYFSFAYGKVFPYDIGLCIFSLLACPFNFQISCLYLTTITSYAEVHHPISKIRIMGFQIQHQELS